MTRYLFRASYTLDGVKGLLKEGGTSRRTVIQKAAQSLGGRCDTFYYAFGEDDVYAIVELPDNVSAAAMALTISGAGAAHLNTVVLLTPEEIDKATHLTVPYSVPKAA